MKRKKYKRTGRKLLTKAFCPLKVIAYAMNFNYTGLLFCFRFCERRKLYSSICGGWNSTWSPCVDLFDRVYGI